jgi:DNA-binding FadR family transcriptional regulator
VALGALDRMDDRPPYRQIADQLWAAIERGELRPGDKLPSEAALMEHYHVARARRVLRAWMPTAPARPSACDTRA